MLPTNCEIKYGPVTNNIYGNVILANVLNGLAPSIRADSYKSSGIFIKIPELISIVYGIPTHVFATMMKILVMIGSLNHLTWTTCLAITLKILLTIPKSSLNIRLININETNWGTAIVVIKIVLHNFFNLTILLLIKIATAIPKK